MDEPTASLTRAEVNRLLAIVARLKAEGIAVVFVSHRLDEVVEIAERVTVLARRAQGGHLRRRRGGRAAHRQPDDRR